MAAKPPRPAIVDRPGLFVARIAAAAAAPATSSDVINWARSASKPMNTNVVLEEYRAPDTTADATTAATTTAARAAWRTDVHLRVLIRLTRGANARRCTYPSLPQSMVTQPPSNGSPGANRLTH